MPIGMAAAYVGLSEAMLRSEGPEPRAIRNRVLFDRADLDRWADRLAGQPISDDDMDREAREAERRFLEKRRGRG